MEGGGKYGMECDVLRETFSAQAVLLVVVGGIKGSGFSLCGTERGLTAIATTLRASIELIEADLRKMTTRETPNAADH